MNNGETNAIAIDEYVAYVKSCGTRGVLPCSLDSFIGALRPDLCTWRELAQQGVTQSVETRYRHEQNDVERALVEETAEPRDLARLAPQKAHPAAVGRPLIVVGCQAMSIGALLDLQRDAARYRWLRNKADDLAALRRRWWQASMSRVAWWS